MARTDQFRNRASACEAHDDTPRSPETGETIGDVIARRFSRREMVRGTLGVVAAASLFGPAALGASKARAEASPERFQFKEIEAGVDTTHHVAEGYGASPCSAGATRCFRIHRHSIRSSRVRRPSSSSSDTTTTTSPIFRSMARAVTASSASITNTPTRS